jgi:hypothetical protein
MTAPILGHEAARARVVQLDLFEELLPAALEAFKATTPMHPSKELVLRLIASSTAWQILHYDWATLMENRANWDTFLDILNCSGEETLFTKLGTRYGLTPGAAEAICRLLVRHQGAGTRVFHGSFYRVAQLLTTAVLHAGELSRVSLQHTIPAAAAAEMTARFSGMAVSGTSWWQKQLGKSASAYGARYVRSRHAFHEAAE